MSAKPSRIRTQQCSAEDAHHRLANAREQVEVAEFWASAKGDRQARSVAAAAAVLGGIAAADAACCRALGERSRSDDHRDAINLIGQISPGGPAAANNFRRLIAIKDEAQYGFRGITSAQFTSTLRRAKALVDFAEEVLQRG